ncbi:DUF4190 domain-containing protein [Kineococcus sp. SYSU DK002]|uniref:DUF4190 domain-containing protein n=1 Tax=Kineococcus sp. SYSU DK002 TaxID=3383123 RepID=UPI003D7ECF59
MSDNGQGDGQRSWWEKPDAEPTPDPYAGAGGTPAGDAHDPYRAAGSSGGTGGSHAAGPTESLPRYGDPSAAGGQRGDQPYPDPSSGNEQYGNPSYGDQPYGNQPYGSQPYGSQPYGSQPYANQPYGNQPFPDQQYGYGQPPVTGMAHAVCWTAVGGLLLSFTLLGWIASIVALALAPGARREILASQGTKRGLGFVLAGKICAWVNLGLSLLAVVLFVLFILIGIGGGWDQTSTFDTNSVNVLFAR